MGKYEWKLNWDQVRRLIAMTLVLCMLLGDGSVLSLAQEVPEETISEEMPALDPAPAEESQEAQNQEESSEPIPPETTSSEVIPETSAREETTISSEETDPEDAETISQEETTEPPTEETTEPALEETVSESGEADAVYGGGLDLSSYSGDLCIYNYMTFNNATNELVVGSGVYDLTGTGAHGVHIGDQSYEGPIEEPANPAPCSRDIRVQLHSADVAAMQIHPVYEGNNLVILTADGDSRIRQLDLTAGSRLDLTLEGDFSIDYLNMAGNSGLTVHLSGYSLTLGGASGEGSLKISGPGSVSLPTGGSVGSLQVEKNAQVSISGDVRAAASITLTDTVLQGTGTESVTAGSAITAKHGWAQDLALLGFSDAQGSCTITLENNSFSRVQQVGAGDGCQAVVTLVGAPSESVETVYTSDFPIVYMHAGKPLLAHGDWPVFYRSGGYGASYQVAGSITPAGYRPGTVNLPAYSLDGYSCKGWKVGEGTEAVSALPGDVRGDLTLTAVMEPADITVIWDLGFDPDETTNNDPPARVHENQVPYETKMDISLQPFRFGWAFTGWKVLTGKNSGTKIIGSEQTHYTVIIDDLHKDPDTQKYSLKLEAQWQAETFPLRFQIQHPNCEISVDGGLTFQTAEALAVAKPAVNYSPEDSILSFNTENEIPYGTTLEDFLTEKLGGMPILRDVSGNNERFAAWGKLSGRAVTGDMAFSITGGLLNPGDNTLQAYNALLHSEPLMLVDQWGKAKYDLTLVDCPEDWEILVNGRVQEKSADGVLSIEEDADVSFRCSSKNSMGFGLWKLTRGDTPFNPDERTYHPGDPYLFYDFRMPSANVTATYRGNQEIWVDLYPSPITFQEKVTHNARTMDGFFYDVDMEEMTPAFFSEDRQAYFYAWEMNRPFYVTSRDQPTQNQLKVVNTMTVHLKQCNLTATDAYLSDIHDRMIGSKAMETYNHTNMSTAPENTWTPYGNIVFDRTKTGKYRMNLIIHGANTVTGVFDSHYRKGKAFISELNITGADGTDPLLNLGGVWGNLDINFNNLSIGELSKDQDPGEYMAFVNAGHLSSGNVNFLNCTVNAPRKRIFSAIGYVSLNNTDMQIGGIRYSYQMTLSGSSFLHVHGDVIGYYYGINLNGSSSMVVDGNMHIMGYESGGSVLNSAGYLIFKGNLMDTGTLTIHNGTLIANTVAIAAECQIDGGRIITNQIVNLPCKRLTPSSVDGSYQPLTSGYGSNVERADGNGDALPFLTYSNHANRYTEYSFSGGDLYLLGYHPASGSYNTSLQATDAENPLSTILGACPQAENGSYDLSALTGEFLQAQVHAAENPDAECFHIGNSRYTSDQQRCRAVKFSGSNIYAAGSVTLLNDTEISGGTLSCAGDLSSKRDLIIKGKADVSARNIGNTYDLTTENEDRLTRWQQTRIEGGQVAAEHLGAVQKSYFGDKTSRSTIRTLGGEISAADIHQDIYVNYITGTAFTRPDGLPDNLHFYGTDLADGMGKQPGGKLVFANPDNGYWKLTTPAGPTVTAVDQNGQLIGETDPIPGENAADRELLALHAQKEHYNLVVKAGAEMIISATSDDLKLTLDAAHTTASVKGKSDVVLEISGDMAEKTVVWYRDGSGVLYSAEYTVDPQKGTVSFRMPVSDTEVWITNELSLDLSEYDIAFLTYGFAISRDPERAADKEFLYQGDLRIRQLNIPNGTQYDDSGVRGVLRYNPIVPRGNSYHKDRCTKHTMEFEPGSGGAFGRSVIIDQVIQDGYGKGYGMEIAPGENVSIKISGAVQLYPVHLPESSSVSFMGERGREQDQLYFLDNFAPRKILYDGAKPSGNAVFQSLNFLLNCGAVVTNADSLQFVDCKMDLAWYAYCYLAVGTDTVILDGCDYVSRFSSDTGSVVFSGVRNLKILNSSVFYDYGTTRSGHPFFQYVDHVTVQDSQIEFDLIETGRSESSEILAQSNLPDSVVIGGNSSLKADHRLMLKNLVLNDDSSLVITSGGHEDDSWLFCPELTVNDRASVQADHIMVSGFYYGNAGQESLVREALKKDTDIVDGSKADYLGRVPTGLTVNGGSVQAASWISADRNGRITINGGTVTAPAIGTCGRIYGYAGYIPQNGQAFAYGLDQVPARNNDTVITITDGKVNVTEGGYLGGMRTKLIMSGGEVNLSNGAVMGLNKDQQTILELQASADQEILQNACSFHMTGGRVQTADLTSGTGMVSVPYGDLFISGTAAMNVYDLTSYKGSLKITETSEGYKNPFTGTGSRNANVGVLVRHELSARDLLIGDGAAVYAEGAFSSATPGENGSFHVQTGTAGSDLYIGRDGFGNMGEGGTLVDEESKIHGSRQYFITYVLNDRNRVGRDPLYTVESNPNRHSYYFSGKSEIFDLESVSRGDFYTFGGWYEDAACEEKPISSINTAIQKDLILYAKWIPVSVEFELSVDNHVITDLATSYDPKKGTYEGGIYTYKTKVKVPYGSTIIGNGPGQLNLTDFALTTYTPTQLEVLDPRFPTGTNKTINQSTVLTKDFLQQYLADGEDPRPAFRLKVVKVAPNNLLIGFDRNLNEQGRPIQSAFIPDPASAVGQIYKGYVSINAKLKDSKDTWAVPGGKLLSIGAPGYAFGGWYEKPDLIGDPITKDYLVLQPENPVPPVSGVEQPQRRFYARWTPKTYQVVFDAGDGNQVTFTDQEPGNMDPQTLQGSVVYDTVIDGNIQWQGSGEKTSSLPYAWKQGYVFVGWSWDGKYTHRIHKRTEEGRKELNLTDIPEPWLQESAGDTDQVALTLTAVYKKVKVSFQLNGGYWKRDGYHEDSEGWTERNDIDFEEAFPGYVRTGTPGAYDYGIHDTLSSDFAERLGILNDSTRYMEAYDPDDYRHSLMRKGYTFAGWYDEDGAEVKTLPDFHNIKVYAHWTPNTYPVNLLNKDPEKFNAGYYHSAFNDAGPNTYEVTVGEMIPANEPGYVGSHAWPPRSEGSSWFAYNETEDGEIPTKDDQKRMVLGFTFDSLDPGDTRTGSKGYQAYKLYAANVVSLQSKEQLFQCQRGNIIGTAFHIPGDLEYGETAMAGTTMVPDYPDGSTIDLYAVYRERSLVFIEYLQTQEGAHNQIMGVYPCDEYVDYPDLYDKIPGGDGNGRTFWEGKGFKLLNWGVNGRTQDAATYPTGEGAQAIFNQNIQQWRTAANDLQTYDIMVYSRYVPQVEVYNGQLTVNTQAWNTLAPHSAFTFTLPGAIQSGRVRYDLVDHEGLYLVSGDEIEKHLYDNSEDWYPDVEGNQNADNTVAIQIELTDTAGKPTEAPFWLQNGSKPDWTNYPVSAGYTINFTLYHAWVIDREQTLDFTARVTFEKLDQQSVTFNQFKVNFLPTQYQVAYQAQLPENIGASVIRDPNLFELQDSGADPLIYTRMLKTNYGSDLLSADQIPQAVGYAGNGSWTWERDPSQTVDYGAAFRLNVTAEDQGLVTLKTPYELAKFLLSADQETLNRWTVAYGTETLADTSPAQVPYLTEVKFTPIGDAHPEFIVLTLGTGENAVRVTLDQYDGAEENRGVYTFSMPAMDVAASYEDSIDLYLEDGTIEIFEDHYIHHKPHGDVVRTWHGSYNILMDEKNNLDDPHTTHKTHATPNTLKLHGDLQGRNINLGNLSITAPDAIWMDDNTTAKLNAAYQGTASYLEATNIHVPDSASLTYEGNNGIMALTPSTGKAAVGGGQNLTLRDCRIQVTEVSQGGQVYTGTWIGGDNTQSVTLENCTLKALEGKGLATAIDADTVTIQNSEIGTPSEPIPSPIGADTLLDITGSKIFQNMTSGCAIGTDPAGTIQVSGGSRIQSAVASPIASIYEGTMLLDSAAEDVVIANRQILDTENGDISITASEATQGSATHDHAGSYLLIHEKPGTAKPSLTVNSIAGAQNIAARTVTLGAVNIHADTPMQAQQDLTLSGPVTIDSGRTLTVDGTSPLNQSQASVILTGSFGDSGTYAQNGGAFQVKSTVSCPNLDMSLSSTETTVSQDLAVHNMTLNQGSVTGTKDSKIGSLGLRDQVTHVKITGTAVTGKTIGALGEKDQTFTFVTWEPGDRPTGQVVRDLYRLSYDVDENPRYLTDQLPKVLRGTSRNGDLTQEVMDPIIPADPQFKPAGEETESAFQNWYLMEEDAEAQKKILHALHLTEKNLPGFQDTLDSLEPDHIQWAKGPAEDGTHTLTLYAWIQHDAEAVIEENRKFEALTGQETTVSIPADWAVTAMFTVHELLPDTAFQFRLPDLPAGTGLTLGILKEGQTLPVFYHCVPSGEVTAMSEFRRMGRPNEAPGAAEPEDRYLLAVDFGSNRTPGDSRDIALEVIHGDHPVSVAKVSYIRTAPAAADLQVSQNQVTVQWPGDFRMAGKNLYLQAAFDPAVDYTGKVQLTSGEESYAPVWISRNQAVFSLNQTGNQAISSKTFQCILADTAPHTYGITWTLTAAESTPSIFDRVLAAKDGGSITIAQGDLPRMKVAVEPALDQSRILTAGEILHFTVDANRPVAVTCEKQESVLTGFKEDPTLTCTGSGISWQVTVPSAPGTYRVRFSINENTEFDDVYAVFLVK